MFGLAGIAIGVVLIVIGLFMVFLFPGTKEHQPETMSFAGIITGFILLIIGGLLIFLP